MLLDLTKGGRNHDYSIFKESEIGTNIPEGVLVNVDLGFQGIKKNYKNLSIKIPHKKPKNKELTTIQKKENRELSGHRVLVENAIGGVKRLRCLTDSYRNKKKYGDKFMLVGCGLWNFYLEVA